MGNASLAIPFSRPPNFIASVFPRKGSNLTLPLKTGPGFKLESGRYNERKEARSVFTEE